MLGIDCTDQHRRAFGFPPTVVVYYGERVQTEPPDHRRLSVLIPSTIAVVLWPPVAVFGSMAFMMSPMLFDAPGSEENQLIYILIAGAGALPVLCLVSVVASIAALVKEWRSTVRRRWAWAGASLPLLALATLLVGSVLLEVICDGQLNCQP